MRPLALLLLAAAASAQPAANWSALEPAAGLALPLGGGFGPKWEADPGPLLRLEAPAYGGHARLALRLATYAPTADTPPADGLPSFVAVFPSLGWGPGVTLPGGVSVRAGPAVGAAHLRFDGGAFGGNLQNETELTVGGWARIDVPLGGRVRVWTEAEATRVALAEPTTLATAAAGLAVRLDTPGWLRTVLQ